MKKIIEIAKIFTLIFVRDRVTLFFTFFFNAFLMVIFGLTISDKYDLTFTLGVVDNIQNTASVQMIDYMEKQPNMVVRKYTDVKLLDNEIANGGLVAGVIINKNNIKQKGDNPFHIEILGDQSRNMWLKFLIPGLKLALTESDESVKAQLNSIPITTTFIESRNLRYFDFIFPGLLIFSIMQIGLTGGLTLLGLRHNENIKRLKITPLKKHQFILGYALSYAVMLIGQVFLFIALGMLIFNYTFSGNIFTISILIVMAGIIFLCLGILLSNWASTPEAGDNFNRFFSLPAAFLCGVYFPLDTLPIYVQKLALAHPLTHIVSVFRGVSNFADSISMHAISFIIIALILVVLAALAMFLFKWEEKTA